MKMKSANSDPSNCSVVRRMIAGGLLVVLLVVGCSTARTPSGKDLVNVSGQLVRKTFPGRPNYESITGGDEAEQYWLLILDQSFNHKPSDPTDVAELVFPNDANKLQLVLSEHQYRKWARLVDKQVEVAGECFRGFSGHHHTDWLVIVNELRLKN